MAAVKLGVSNLGDRGSRCALKELSRGLPELACLCILGERSFKCAGADPPAQY
jgi:hypothetical protein